MIACPLCLKQVPHLKTNSHILPRWMLAAIKQNGKLIKVDVKNKVVVRAQSDTVADIVCEDCEGLFTECDTFADQFFKYKKFQLPDMVVQSGNEKVTLEVHKEEAKPLLIRFVASVMIRQHLYQVQNGDLSPSSYFERLRENFVNKISLDDLKIQIAKHVELPNLHSYRAISESSSDSFELTTFGYRSTLYFGHVPAEYLVITEYPEILITLILGKDNALHQNLGQFASENPVQNGQRKPEKS
ncbi:MAG: hypothetical protein OM95_15655 [Bdellovibrio sp. ArHS]|nr:MAG: hypothetical protein OM95_15655 [Bdellovibrio sp. ArHS]